MGHRSTSVGDRMSVCYQNNKGNGFYEKIFRVDDVGFSLCMTKNHVDGKKNTYEEALKSLSEKQRDVFLMSRLDALSYKDIAERLDISVKAVEKRISGALSNLRKSILVPWT